MDDNDSENSEFCKQTAASVTTSENFFSNFQSHTALIEEYDKVRIEDSNLIQVVMKSGRTENPKNPAGENNPNPMTDNTRMLNPT